METVNSAAGPQVDFQRLALAQVTDEDLKLLLEASELVSDKAGNRLLTVEQQAALTRYEHIYYAPAACGAAAR